MAEDAFPGPSTPFHAVLEASGVVGAWMHDLWDGRLALTGSLAALLGLDPAAAAHGVPLAAFLARTHPEDRTRIENYLHAVGETGGPIEAEFRTLATRAGSRKLLMRGRIERDASGRTARGQGIAIDLTEGQAASLAQAERLVNRMAEHAITLRSLAEALQRPGLVRRVDGLMIEIGFELARHLRAPKSGDSRH
ncbi:PAS domain-containing protein [Methylobacterium sp. A54F]